MTTVQRRSSWSLVSIRAARGLALAVFAAACGESGGTTAPDPDPDPDPAPTASSLTLTAPVGTLLPVDWQTMLGVMAFDEEGQSIAVSPVWTSSAPTVASVSTVGLVSTHGPGPAVMTATVDGGAQAHLPLTVVDADLDVIEMLLADPYAERLVTSWGGASADEYAAAAHACRTHLGLGNLTALLLCVDGARERLAGDADPGTAPSRALLGFFLDGAERQIPEPSR